MSHEPILTGTKNPVLRQKAKPVQKGDSQISHLLAEMRKAMKEEKGVGLAAPQIGVSKRVILVTFGEEVVSMINPEITSFSAECNIDEEGCLSVPGEWGNVSRSTRISLEYIDEKGKQQKRYLSNFDARVVQHEIDHLNGVLFTDRLISKKEQEQAESIFG